jgi:hypothetical protein
MKIKSLLAALLCAATLWVAVDVHAQETSSPSKPVQSEKPRHGYHLDFSVNELEGGKKINSRQYAMNAYTNTGTQNIQIGIRVPVEVHQGESSYTYLDIGTTILCRMDEEDGMTTIYVEADVTSLATPEPDKRGDRPVIRRAHISARSAITPGKPVTIGSVDDPNSNRQFQLEVLATKQ